MKCFERTNKLANILFMLSAVFFIAMWILAANGSVIEQVFQFSNGNYVRSGILFAFFLTSFLFSIVLGIALKCISRDAKEELDAINKKTREKNE